MRFYVINVFCWVLLGAWGGFGFHLLQQVKQGQTELKKENTKLKDSIGEFACGVYDCAVELEECEERWGEYQQHAFIAEFMCSCMGPPPYENDAACWEAEMQMQEWLDEEEKRLEEEYPREW